MAVYGYIPVAPGDKLTSAHMNGVAGQTIMRFANSETRGQALSSAVASKGMVTYLDDVGRLETYNGSAWVPFNAVKGGYYSILHSATAVSLPGNDARTRVIFQDAVTTAFPQAPGYRNFEVSNTSTASGLKIPATGLYWCLLHAQSTATPAAGTYTIEFEVNGNFRSYGIQWPSQFMHNLTVPVMYPLLVNDVVGAQCRYSGTGTGTMGQVHLTIAGPL